MVVVPTCKGNLNKRVLPTRSQRLATVPRADLAKSLGLSQSTPSRIMGDLLVVDDVAVREACTARVPA